MSKIFVSLLILLQSALTLAQNTSLEELDAWMKPLVGQYQKTGDTGCDNFKIVRVQNWSRLSMYYVYYGPVRTPQEDLLFNASPNSKLEVTHISESKLAAKVHVPAGIYFDTPAQNISFEIEKDQQGKLKSIEVSTRRGFLFPSVVQCE